MDEFETLLASGKTAVERWVRARTSRPADAEDILQEIYLAAFQSFSGLRNHDAFLPWILSIAKRKYADWYRAQTRRREIPMDQLPEKAAKMCGRSGQKAGSSAAFYRKRSISHREEV